jgi:DMSO/TMAO reductase YedYZ molybdopterin-dependent catalytic subunit
MKKIFPIATIILLTTTAIALFIFTTPSTQADSTNSVFQLRITGYVERPSNFTLADLQAMTKTTVSAAIYCVDAPNVVVEQGSWEGVKLWDLLNQTGVSPSAVKVALYASDGYSSDLSIDLAKQDNVILAYSKDGSLLSGLRLVVPGHWGYKWINQVQSIKLVNYDFLGRWESQGYSDDGLSQSDHGFGPSNPTTPPITESPTATIQASPSTSPKESPATSSPAAANSTLSSSQPQKNAQNIGAIEIVTTVIMIGVTALAVIPLVRFVKRKKNIS